MDFWPEYFKDNAMSRILRDIAYIVVLAVLVLLILSFISSKVSFGTVSTSYEPEYFVCNGSTTTFNFSFPISNPTSDVTVYLTDGEGTPLELTLDADYTLSATNNDYTNGGTVTTTAIYSSDYTLVVTRDTALTQEATFVNNPSLENTLDRQTLSMQEVRQVLNRAIRAPITDEDPSMELPWDRASRWLAFDADKNVIASAGPTGDSSIPVSSYIENLLDDENAGEAAVTLSIIGVENIETYGADNTGVSDSQEAFTNAITAASSDGVIYIPEGTFLADSTITITKSLRIIGSGKGSIIKSSSSAYTFTVTGGTNLILENFVIDGDSTGGGILLTSNLALFRMENVTSHDTNLGVVHSAATVDITRVEIVSNIIKDCLDGVRLAGNISSAYIAGNLIDTLTETGSVNGFWFGSNVYADQDKMKRYIFTDNIINNVTTTGVGSEAHAILVYGREAIIKNNIINLVTNNSASTSGAEAIYTKCRYAKVQGNIVIDGGRSPNGAIAIKGSKRGVTASPQGFGVRCTGNTLLESAIVNKCGVWIGNQDVLVADNYLYGLSGIAIATAETSQLDNIAIERNTIIAHKGNYPIAVANYGQGLRVKNNYITELLASENSPDHTFGIVVTAKTGDYNDIEISGNHIEEYDESSATVSVRGIQIQVPDDASRIQGLKIKDNIISITNTSIDVYGIYITIASSEDPAITQLVMTGNDCSRVSGHNAAGTLPLAFATSDETLVTISLFKDNTFFGPYQTETSNFNIEFEYNGDIFTNNGAGDTITGILPIAQPGLLFHFAAVDDKDLRIDPDSTDTIIGGSGAGKYISLDTLGDTTSLECVIANEWIIKGGYGDYATE